VLANNSLRVLGITFGMLLGLWNSSCTFIFNACHLCRYVLAGSNRLQILLLILSQLFEFHYFVWNRWFT